MTPSCSSEKRWLHTSRTVLSWTRRVALLGSVSVSLALAGQSMTSGASTALAFRVGTETSAHSGETSPHSSGADQTAVRTLTDRLRGSLGLMPERYADQAGLFVLGLSLIGAGHVLARRPARKRRDQPLEQSPNRTDSVLRPYVVARGSSRGAAR